LYVTLYIEGFSHFVTSMTAPITSGRSDLAGWGLHPLEQRHLFTAHTQIRQSAFHKAAIGRGFLPMPYCYYFDIRQ
ncbi:MAG: hypothetical protein ACHP65_10200, partial [Legionellales bacterium]